MSKSVNLSPEQFAFVEALVAAGRYPSADAAVVESLSLLEAREQHLGIMREAWREGVESGDYEPIEAALDDIAARYDVRAKAGS